MLDDGYSKYFKPPSNEMFDSIILTSQGDIRSAVLNLHLTSLKNTPKMLLEKIEENSKTNKSKGGGSLKCSSLGSDESITMMHALGRVLNPKCWYFYTYIHYFI